MVAPDGSAIVAPLKRQPDSSLVKALARTSRWQKLLDGASTAPGLGSPGGVDKLGRSAHNEQQLGVPPRHGAHR
jgi:hypothetical protein